MAEPSTTRAARRKTWRGIRTRLAAVLLIPTLAALGLGSLRVANAAQDFADANRAASIAGALPASIRLALQLQVERDAGTVNQSARNLRQSGKEMAQVRATTDQAIKIWRAKIKGIDASRDAKLRQDLNTIKGLVDRMPTFRGRLARPDTQIQAQTEYTNTLNLLLGLAQRVPELGSADDLYDQAAGLGQIRTAAEALADERTLVAKALSTGRISSYDLTSLASAASTFAASSGFFYDHTSPRAQKEFETINGGSGDVAGSHAAMQAAVGSLLSTGDPESTHLNPATWNAVSSDFLAQMAGVVTTAATTLASSVEDRRTAAKQDALLNAATVLALLVLVLVATTLVARSILRPLHRLRDAALDIAQHGLPERVRRLEESDEVGDLSVTPISVGSRDEIAEVAEAFDAVHTEAIRLAGEQTQMRANVNRMFVNLSRRSQSLVERQLRLIDELESGEQDPEHLANLFRLDHLATRMRRNDESLMVLAGGDTGQGARGPVPVLDVLRAASSEVEQFARVEIESGETAKFRGSVAGDLVHLLAELVENATNFSPPDTTVVVRSSRTSPVSPLVIEVRDLGIGMTPHELDAANEKLRSTGGLDADVARMMGLVVAARLADRHGLSVELRTNSPRGVVARVEVPTSVLVQPETRSALLVDAVEAPSLPPVLPASSAPEQLRLPERTEDPLAPSEPEPLVASERTALDDPVLPEEPAPAAETAEAIETLETLETLEPRETLEPVVVEAEPAPAAEPEQLAERVEAAEPVLDEAPAEAEPAEVVPAKAETAEATGLPTLPTRPVAAPLPPSSAALPGAPMPAVRPPDGYDPNAAASAPIASEPPVKSWFTTTVPLRDPEELLNTYLTGRAEGVDGAIKSPFANMARRNGSPLKAPAAGDATSDGSPNGSSAAPAPVAPSAPADGAGTAPADRSLFGAAPAAPVDRVAEPPVVPDEKPTAPPLTSSGLPTRVPRASLPAEKPFDAFGGGPAAPAPAAPAPAAAAPVPEPEPARPTGPVLDPLIAELAADVLNAPSAEEALAAADSSEESDDSSIFASLQSEWFTRRTPLEARRAQPDVPAVEEPAEDATGWVSPGDEGWRRAAELAEPAGHEEGTPTTTDGLPMRVPGRNLVPGSADPAPLMAPVAENVVPLPRLERRRTRGLSSFQQGVSRARTTDNGAADDSEEITVPGAYDPSENRAHEEHL